MVMLSGGSAWDLSKFKWPWEKSVEEHVKEVEAIAPLVGMISPFSATGGILSKLTGKGISKIIVKTPGLVKGAVVGGAAVGAGMLLFGGGGSQEQKQDQTLGQEISQNMRDLMARLKATQQLKATQTTAQIIKPEIVPTVTSTYDIRAGGDVDIGGVTTATTTYTSTVGPTQYMMQDQTATAEALNKLMGLATQTAEQTATQETDNTMLLVAAALAAIFLLKGGLK